MGAAFPLDQLDPAAGVRPELGDLARVDRVVDDKSDGYGPQPIAGLPSLLIRVNTQAGEVGLDSALGQAGRLAQLPDRANGAEESRLPRG